MKATRSPIILSALLFVFLILPLDIPAQTNAVPARVTHAVDMRNLVALRGNVHPLARREYDAGVAPDDLPMERILLVLQRGADQEASLRQMLDQQQVQSSSQFHQWLTPEQFGRQFGPADSDVQAVTNWLATEGFAVSKVSAGRSVIEFSGTAGLVREVLGTEVHKFRVNGADYWANASDPQIPAALASVIAGIASLNNFPSRPLHENVGTFSRSKMTGEVKPLFTFPFSGGFYIAVGPTDFATIYNVAPLWTAGTDGTGQTVAVVGRTNINIQDVRDFRTMFGLPAIDPSIILNGPDPGITPGDETEADLDVEWSGAVAKGATIDLVVSESTESTDGIDLSALYIVDNNLAPIMSVSYGSCEAVGSGVNAFHSTLLEQAAAQGITVLVASGDSGSAGCDSVQQGEIAAQYGLAVSGFASTPFNVSVGGTDFNDFSVIGTYWNQTNASPGQNSAKSYIPEMPWNDSCSASGLLTACNPPPDMNLLNGGFYLAAGGGGKSSCRNPSGTFPNVTCPGGGYAKPSWQTGTGVPTDGVRDIPDISLFASGGSHASFYVICEMDANASGGGSATSCDLNAPYLDFQGVGGTSAAAPTLAGIMALVTQTHGRQGNANYVFYPLAAKAGNTCVSNAAAVTNTSCIFYDIDNATGSTSVNSGNSVICLGGTPNCSNTSTSANEYGNLVSGSPASAAFTTTAGYDLATGLGSVNAANLVNHWASNFTTSTSTLQLSTSPATSPLTQVHGKPINFDIKVAAGSGTPSGDVSLIAQNGNTTSDATGIGPFTLSGGAVSGSTIFLPGGSYSVTAHYAGNGTFAASDSPLPGVPIIVTKESSHTEIHFVTFDPLTGALSYGSTSAVYGTLSLLRMDVTNSSGNLCANMSTEVISYACPTGNIIVSPTPTDLMPPPGALAGHYTLNTQGYAEDQYLEQPPGNYPFVATYAGDVSYLGSNGALAVTITQAQTATSISGVPSTALAGTQITVNATVTTASYGAAPMGTMQLLDNGSPFGSSVVVSGTAANSSSLATAQALIPATLPTGSFSISARYSGDIDYMGSTSGAVAVNVANFALSASPSPINISAPGQGGSSTLSVTPQNGFTGTVNLSVASGCPIGATCTLASPSVNVTTASAVTDILTITTTGTASALPTLHRRTPPSFRLPAGLLWLVAGSLVLAMLLFSSANRLRPVALLFVTMMVIAGAWVACGGGGTTPTPPPAPTPGVGLSASTLTFSSQNVGIASPVQSVTLTDTGNASLTVTGVSLTGANSGDFRQTNTCGSSVVAGANCAISVTFQPTSAGTRSASVSIADNATGSPHNIALSGTGIVPATPAGTYPIVINAVSGGDSHPLTVNLNVQ